MAEAATARQARPDEAAALGRALALAFTEDPVWSWLLPGPAGRTRRLERFFTLELAHVVLPGGVAWTVDGQDGACLALPPGRWRMPLSAQIRHAPEVVRVFGHRLPWALAMLGRMEARHLRAPHWYLPYIGVTPGAQGRGLGQALMQPLLQRCDDEGLPTYLEASSPRSAELYRRLGFVDVAELRLGSSPPLALMRRDPVRAAGRP